MVSTINTLLRQRAEEQPQQRGYTFLLDGEAQETHLTYQALNRQAQAIATLLQHMGAHGARALLIYPPGLDYIAAFFGCLYAGTIPVPIYPPDPLRLNRTLPRLRAIVADSQATIALTTENLLGVAALLFEQAPDLAALQWCATDTVAPNTEAASASAWRPPEITPESLAFLQYTSGSTGQPKGVMLSHANLLHNLALIHNGFAVTPISRGVIWLPPYHDMGLIGGILQPLYGGFPVVLLSPLDFLKRPLRWLQAITRYRATISGGPNFAYDLCVRKITPEQRATLDLSCWTIAFNGAEPIRPETIDRFASTFAPCSFRRSMFYPCYGLAEATLIVTGGGAEELPVVRHFNTTALERGQAEPVAPDHPQAQPLVSSGRPLTDQQLLIVHPTDRTHCAPGQTGEVWVASPSVAQGYWRQPEVTAAAFQAALIDVELPGATASVKGFLRTGDLGFLLDGELFISGRLKDLIIIRGRNQHPQDIERTAEQRVPALRPGCSAAFAIDIAGEEQLVLVHEVERSTSELEPIAAAVRAAIAEQYELQAYCVCLLAAGSLPKTSSGKVQRHACRADFLDGSLEVVYRSILEHTTSSERADGLTRDALLRLEPPERYARLRDDLQILIAQVLRLEASGLASQQPLTAIGIDSLRAIELQRRLEDHLGLTLPVATFLDGHGIDQIAAQIIETLEDAPRVGPLDAMRPPLLMPTQHKALSAAQERLWFMDQLAPGRTAYSIPITVRLSGSLNIRALGKSLTAIVTRHESLRTTFQKIQSRPVPVIGPPTPPQLLHADLCALPNAKRATHRDTLIAEMTAQPFDLSSDALLRVALVYLATDEHVLVLTMHHIIADGWSIGLFLGELTLFYTAFITDEQPLLPPLPIQYTDFAHAQQQWFQAGGLNAQLAYWQRKLAGAPPILELPTDFPRPVASTLRGAHHFFLVESATHAALEAFSREQGATLYMTLLSAFLILLHSYTKRDDMIIGTDLANRHWAGTECLIGLFVNQLVLRIDLSANPSAQQVLRRVREVALDAYVHPDVPFDRLVEVLKPLRDPSRNPLFQVMFVLENAPLPPLELPGLRLELLEVDSGGAPFDLSLLISQTASGLKGDLRYSTDLFTATTIARMAGQFRLLLKAIVDQPEARLSELRQFLDGTEQRQQSAQAEALRVTRSEKFEQLKRRKSR